MLTAQESLLYVGRVALLSVDGLRVEVKVLDARHVWARVDCLVVPLRGEGERWVSLERLSFKD